MRKVLELAAFPSVLVLLLQKIDHAPKGFPRRWKAAARTKMNWYRWGERWRVSQWSAGVLRKVTLAQRWRVLGSAKATEAQEQHGLLLELR